VIAWGSSHKGYEGELAKAGTRFVLRALLVLAAASTGGLPVHAQDTAHAQDKDNCLAAPAGKTPPGSHWHYRTDPVKQTKCWYLRSDGEAAQSPAAADGTEAAGGPPRPAAATPKAAADAGNAASRQHKPHQAAHAGAKSPAPATQNPAAPQSSQGAAQWPDPPQQATAGPPPQQAAQGGAAWPDPPQAPANAANAPWPDPPSTGAPTDPATTNATPDASNGQETGTVNPSGAAETATDAPQSPAAGVGNLSGRGMLALVVAMACIVGGILMRWLLGKFFARRRKVAAERREPLWQTDEYVMPDALTRGVRNMPDHIDPERLDAEAKQALRKLLRTLERSAA
jgi:hypothetical protein